MAQDKNISNNAPPDLPAMLEISIVICTYNRAEQLPKALEALLAMRCEASWEAIIVDNASSDDTAQVIESYAKRDPRIIHVFEEEQGLGAARDTAWRAARGSIISFTDDDCYVAKNYADMISKVFRDRPELGFVGGRILLHNPTDARVTIDERDKATSMPADQFVDTGSVHGANLSFRKSVLSDVGGFDRKMGAGTPFPCEDIDVAARAIWKGYSGGFDPQPIVSHDHGRKQADVAPLMHSYDLGRAAYYAKFLLARQSASAYRSGIVTHLQQMGIRVALKKWWLYAFYGGRFIGVGAAGRLFRFYLFMGAIFAAFLTNVAFRKTINFFLGNGHRSTEISRKDDHSS